MHNSKKAETAIHKAQKKGFIITCSRGSYTTLVRDKNGSIKYINIDNTTGDRLS